MAKRQQESRWLIPRLLVVAVVEAAFVLAGPSLSARTPPASRQAGAQTSSAPSEPAATPEAGQSRILATLPKGKKLILTDGTFQMVREYAQEGDRVRYYSVERSDWEEIPASLVDWPATQKAEAEQETRDKQLVEKIKAGEAAARTAEIDSDRSLEVRPGVILPDEAGLYVLDDGHVTTMEQDLAVSRLSTGREVGRIVTGVPFISSKHFIELPGKRAKIRVHESDLEFYFRPVDGRDAQFSLLRLDDNGDKREVETMNTNVAGISTYKKHELRLLGLDAARGVKRFTVEEKVEPGEYALVETRPDGEVELYVWDFGVDAVPAGKNPKP
jgi:hypothetical protein